MELMIKPQQAINPYREALSSLKVMELKKSEAMKTFADIISKVFLECGQTCDRETLQLLCIGLHDEVKVYFPFIKMDEIRLCFQNGLRNEYGEYFGINIKTFHTWLRAYQTSEARKNAIKAIKEEQEPAPKFDKVQAEKDWWAMVIKQFIQFQKYGTWTFPPAFQQWNFFEHRGLVRLSNGEKWTYYEKAKKELATRSAEGITNPILRKRIKSMREAIEENRISIDDENEIRAVAVRLAVENFYMTQTEEEFTNAVNKIISEL